MAYFWLITSFVAAIGVYLHSSGREESHAPMMSIFLRKPLSPFRCALYVLIGGPFGLAEYLAMWLMARSRAAAQAEVKVTAAPDLSGEELRQFWDQKFREGLDLNPQPES